MPPVDRGHAHRHPRRPVAPCTRDARQGGPHLRRGHPHHPPSADGRRGGESAAACAPCPQRRQGRRRGRGLGSGAGRGAGERCGHAGHLGPRASGRGGGAGCRGTGPQRAGSERLGVGPCSVGFFGRAVHLPRVRPAQEAGWLGGRCTRPSRDPGGLRGTHPYRRSRGTVSPRGTRPARPASAARSRSATRRSCAFPSGSWRRPSSIAPSRASACSWSGQGRQRRPRSPSASTRALRSRTSPPHWPPAGA